MGGARDVSPRVTPNAELDTRHTIGAAYLPTDLLRAVDMGLEALQQLCSGLRAAGFGSSNVRSIEGV